MRSAYIPVADPGYPGVMPTANGWQPIILPNCLKNCMKMKKIGPVVCLKFVNVYLPLLSRS